MTYINVEGLPPFEVMHAEIERLREELHGERVAFDQMEKEIERLRETLLLVATELEGAGLILEAERVRESLGGGGGQAE